MIQIINLLKLLIFYDFFRGTLCADTSRKRRLFQWNSVKVTPDTILFLIWDLALCKAIFAWRYLCAPAPTGSRP